MARPQSQVTSSKLPPKLQAEQRQKSLIRWVLTRRMTFVDLEAADLDDDGLVSPSRFVLYKLKEIGKISEEDIAM
ncbi:hypothetical protein HPP92_028358 [Vanilla planifolia]|uniref:Uncharacterized protein n=1 Tax=Vanilla planifolia TaxID=51239 RepID=A0A835P7S3_VANPL|nr:hypothetical protein HPP92_028358 [Vanilla planifolia]